MEQLRRSVGNYQMEQTRANRLQQEKDQLMVQFRELEKMNTQLKTSNQVCATHAYPLSCVKYNVLVNHRALGGGGVILSVM